MKSNASVTPRSATSRTANTTLSSDQSAACAARRGDRFLGEVEVREAAVRKGATEDVQCVARAAPDVGAVESFLEAGAKARHELKRAIQQRGVDGVLRHLAELAVERGEARLWHAAAVAEAPHHVLLDGAEHAGELCERSQVVDSGGVFRTAACSGGSEYERDAVSYRHDATGRQRTQHLAHVPLVKVRSSRVSPLVDGGRSASVSNSPV